LLAILILSVGLLLSIRLLLLLSIGLLLLTIGLLLLTIVLLLILLVLLARIRRLRLPRGRRRRWPVVTRL
jgi:hypothetical protein